jgi:type 1 glutamine amidotransferase
MKIRMKMCNSLGLSMFLCTFIVGVVTTGLPAADFSALIFSKTLLYRHASITNGIRAIKALGEQNRFTVEATEDSSWFTPAKLKMFKVIIFLGTSGEILSDAQQSAFKDFIEQGGGLVAIHAAVAGDLATEGGWPWYGEALCASFTNHSAVVQATVRVEDRKHSSTKALPERWVRTDEWYNFISSPRGKARVLATLDEDTYKGGTMGADHPIVWCRRMGKGLVWYTALGHTEASFSEPLLLQHLLGGIQAAAGVKGLDVSTN